MFLFIVHRIHKIILKYFKMPNKDKEWENEMTCSYDRTKTHVLCSGANFCFNFFLSPSFVRLSCFVYVYNAHHQCVLHFSFNFSVCLVFACKIPLRFRMLITLRENVCSFVCVSDEADCNRCIWHLALSLMFRCYFSLIFFLTNAKWRDSIALLVSGESNECVTECKRWFIFLILLLCIFLTFLQVSLGFYEELKSRIFVFYLVVKLLVPITVAWIRTEKFDHIAVHLYLLSTFKQVEFQIV